MGFPHSHAWLDSRTSHRSGGGWLNTIMKFEDIKIEVSAKDRNFNYTLSPDKEEVKSIKDAIDWLETIKDDFEEEELPF